MTDKVLRHLLKCNLLCFSIKQRKNKEKIPVKSSFNKEVYASIYLQGKLFQTENTLIKY